MRHLCARSMRYEMELYSIIKNEGSGGLLFWKHPNEDFRTGSQLVVAENEDALFCKDGVIYEVFSGGQYSLHTKNYPFVDKLLAKFSGGVSAFNCKVYFVNKADALELKWGTDSPIQVRDPVFGIATQIVSRGSYSIRVVDSKKFVLKFVGNNFQSVTTEAIRAQFRSAIIQKIKTAIASAVRTSNEEILGLASHLDEFAEKVGREVSPILDEYGVELVNFYVSAVDIPEDAPGRVKLEGIMAQRVELNVLGNDWQRVQTRDILMATATNTGTPGLGAGLGMGLASMGAFGGLAAQSVSSATMSPPQAANVGDTGQCPSCRFSVGAGVKFCPNCGTKIPTVSFCPNCGKPASQESKFCQECGTKLRD